MVEINHKTARSCKRSCGPSTTTRSGRMDSRATNVVRLGCTRARRENKQVTLENRREKWESILEMMVKSAMLANTSERMATFVLEK